MSSPYGAGLPPALVTVENGFTFSSDNMDDCSDLSSLNTTPSKSDRQTLRKRISPGEIDEADLGLHLSKANRFQSYNQRAALEKAALEDAKNEEEEPSNITKQNPPLNVVQVDSTNVVRGGDDAAQTTTTDPRVVNEEENAKQSSNRANRDQIVKDRKEKYRRMTAEPSLRMRRHGALNSWKKKADERRAAERSMPWYVPADNAVGPDDEVSPVKEHDFEQDKESPPKTSPEHIESTPPQKPESKSKDVQETAPVKEELESPPPPPPPESSTPDTDRSDERRKQRSIVAKKNRFLDDLDNSDSSLGRATPVDMYGCPIFRAESEDEDLKNAKKKLDRLDAELAKDDNSLPLKEMLSSASFLSSTAARKLTEASSQGALLLNDSVQVMEDMLLGPVEEVSESGMDEDGSSSSDSEPPPPPKSPPRKGTVTSNNVSPATSPPRDSPPKTESPVKTPPQEVSSSSEPSFHSATGSTSQSGSDTMRSTTAQKGANNSFQESEPETSFVLDDSSEVDVHHVLDDLKSFEKNDDGDGNIAEELTTLVTGDASLEDVGSLTNKNSIVTPTKETKYKVASVRKETGYKVASVRKETNERLANEYSLYDCSILGKESPLKDSEDKPRVVEDDKVKVGDPEAASAKAISKEVAHDAKGRKNDSVDNQKKSVHTSGDSATSSPGSTGASENGTSLGSVTKGSKVKQSISLGDNVLRDSNVAAATAAIGAAGVALVVPEAAPAKAKAREPEFPPTDDADLEFDMSSVKTGCSELTAVRGNLDVSKVAAKKEAKKKATKAKPSGSREGVSVRRKPENSKVAAKPDKKKAPPPAKPVASVAKEAKKDTKADVDGSVQSKPAMVKTLDDNNGIAKGDIVISLLNANLNDTNRAPKGADQVRDAILRMRSMRRRQEKVELAHYEPEEQETTENSNLAKRSVVPVDVDDMRVVDGFDHVKTLEDEAIEHLKHDEIDAAIELYDEITVTYSETFKTAAQESPKAKSKKGEKEKSKNKDKDQSGYQSYVGAALHNIGILNLLQFDFEKALCSFTQAAASRKEHFGAGSMDHLASLNKIALCHFAMNEFEEAHSTLEEALEFSKNHLASLTDFQQISEILNNLGCLSFMCGQTAAAMTMFKECLEIQNAVLKQSLYGGPRLAGQSTSLNISVTRANVGYVRMLTKNAAAAIVEFEASLMHQQMILSDAHDTLICTMDHLAVANLLAGHKEEALKMLSRMLRAQLDAYGPDDERCVLTLTKLQLVQTQETDYLEKALDQLWNQHTNTNSPTKSAKSADKRSKNLLKKLSFRKKAAKMNHQ